MVNPPLPLKKKLRTVDHRKTPRAAWGHLDLSGVGILPSTSENPETPGVARYQCWERHLRPAGKQYTQPECLGVVWVALGAWWWGCVLLGR